MCVTLKKYLGSKITLGETTDLGHLVSSVSQYIAKVKQYASAHGGTTEIQVDTLVYAYRITGSHEAFALLFQLHEKLLHKLVNEQYNRYKRHLTTDDNQELFLMASEEFYRRVLFYEIPSTAPFSKYIKLYIGKWLRSYVKLMYVKADRYVLAETDITELLQNTWEIKYGNTQQNSRKFDRISDEDRRLLNR